MNKLQIKREYFILYHKYKFHFFNSLKLALKKEKSTFLQEGIQGEVVYS